MSGPIEGGGYHWQDKERVENWTDRAQEMSIRRKAGFDALLAHLPINADAPLHFVDLGAGDGTVSAHILSRYQHATGELVDFSEPMIEEGQRKLNPFSGRYSYFRWDMNVGVWPAEILGPFDAIVSAAAIHHLDNERKRWLTTQVLPHLVRGGVFANLDAFRDPIATFGPDEIHGATCATLEETRGFLTDAGFANVEIKAVMPRPERKSLSALVVGSRP